MILLSNALKVAATWPASLRTIKIGAGRIEDAPVHQFGSGNCTTRVRQETQSLRWTTNGVFCTKSK
jgi:hypothetical protein